MPESDDRKDLRRHPRYAIGSGALQVSWLDTSGRMRTTKTRTLNVSEDGIALELPAAVMPEMTMIRFESDRFKVKGKGVVRYCQRIGKKFVVGVSFSGDLHWRAPAGDVRTPIPLCGPGSKGLDWLHHLFGE